MSTRTLTVAESDGVMPEPPVSATPPATNAYRPDVQGLRAVAVLLVIAYHLYPDLIPGGYIGVDVFFVISGFLITGNLAREAQRHGRVRLLSFYGRRARRLLPAAVLVLTVTWLMSLAVLPVTQLRATAEQVRASALYYQNWLLAHDAVDYLAQESAPSPVQHFWSLSVEEQFYLVWPLLFLVASVVALLSRRAVGDAGARLVAPQRAMVFLAAAVVVGSLISSVILTGSEPATAYFVLTTRVWELACGGLLALVMHRLGRPRWAPLAAWVGLAAILVSAAAYSTSTPFPGSAAVLPVGGAVLLLVFGYSGSRWSTARIATSRPMVFVGDVSYAAYLWHWPLIILWLAARGGTIGVLDGPLILVATLGLSWATKVWVEDPIRRAPRIARSTTASLAVASMAVVPVVLTTAYLSGLTEYDGELDAEHPGAAALADHPDYRVGNVDVETLLPPLESVREDLQLTAANSCSGVGQRLCTFGEVADPTLTVALVGDSHAGHWSSAMARIAERQDWKLVTAIRDGCAWTSAVQVDIGGGRSTACHAWGADVKRRLLDEVRPDVVVLSDRAIRGTFDHPEADPVSWAQMGQGTAEYAADLAAEGIRVVALRETPEPGHDVPDCLASVDGSVRGCSTPSGRAVREGTPLVVASEELGAQLPLVDLTDLFCVRAVCPPAIGDVIVYRDAHHLTEVYSLALVPYLEKRLLATGAFAAAQ